MTAAVIRADARSLPLPDASADLIVTSPPYFGLRSYTDGGEHYDGQIGSEATPREYVAALLDCTREWMRVLKPEGSLFINLGDKYDSSSHSMHGTSSGQHIGQRGKFDRRPVFSQPKSLMGLPWRYALGCVDDLGLILRAEIVWAKPNGLPESVQDRVRRSHEQVFHFTRSARYFAAVDEIRQPHQPQSVARSRRRYDAGDSFSVGSPNTLDPAKFCNPLGALPGSVWEIPSAPLVVPAHLGVDHFAAYPPELVRRIVLGWSPAGICVECGEGRRPIHDGSEKYLHRPSGARFLDNPGGTEVWGNKTSNVRTVHRITGYACACPQPDAPTHPAVVVDPFGGTGTTALVASAHGRAGITVDRSADYCRLAQWRTSDPGERARALGVPKPPPVPDGQGSLFERLG